MAIFGFMKDRFRNALAISLLPQVALVLWLRQVPEFVETWYSKGLYPWISTFFHRLYGWIPFSLGDCLYAVLIVLTLVYLVKNRGRIRRQPLEFLRNILVVLAVAYFSFHLLWGFNYYRQPLSKTLTLDDTYSVQDLIALTEQLIDRSNALQLQLSASDPNKKVEVPYSQVEILKKTVQGYASLQAEYPFMSYPQPSIKKSLFSTLLTYMGYGGYLNPFTNEAQVNRKIPAFRFPVICGHEIGHQLGYSAENETNFIGYLVTTKNSDPYFRYAANAYAANYCLFELKRLDTVAFMRLQAGFNKGVLENYRELDEFWKAYKNPMEPVFKAVFNSFLKANNQEEGIQSYNRIVTLLVTYHRKHPL